MQPNDFEIDAYKKKISVDFYTKYAHHETKPLTNKRKHKLLRVFLGNLL